MKFHYKIFLNIFDNQMIKNILITKKKKVEISSVIVSSKKKANQQLENIVKQMIRELNDKKI